MLLNQKCNFLRKYRRKLQVNYKQFIATVSTQLHRNLSFPRIVKMGCLFSYRRKRNGKRRIWIENKKERAIIMKKGYLCH